MPRAGAWVASSKEPTGQRRRCKRRGLHPWVRKVPWRRPWQPPPVFWPGDSHGQRSLAGCSPRGRKESDTPERARPAQRWGWGMGPSSFCCSGVSDSVTPRTVAHQAPLSCDSPGQNTGVGGLSILQSISPTEDQAQVSCITGRFFTAEPPGNVCMVTFMFCECHVNFLNKAPGT